MNDEQHRELNAGVEMALAQVLNQRAKYLMIYAMPDGWRLMSNMTPKDGSVTHANFLRWMAAQLEESPPQSLGSTRLS